METPFVSFCITNYNQKNYLAETLNAAYSQDYPNMEIVISDDASTDGSVAEINKIIANKTTEQISIGGGG